MTFNEVKKPGSAAAMQKEVEGRVKVGRRNCPLPCQKKTSLSRRKANPALKRDQREEKKRNRDRTAHSSETRGVTN